MKIAVLMGTRPEALKNYSIAKALREMQVDHLVLHTNQHRDGPMNAEIFSELGYSPDLVFTAPYHIGGAIDWVSKAIREHRIDTLLVNGDTAAALIGAIAALYCDIRLVHVEAGLRSGDAFMVEERNRIMVDAVAHTLFAYTQSHAQSLAMDRNIRGRIHNVGNTSIDLIADFTDAMPPPDIGRYAFITMHRKEFTESKLRMVTVFAALNELAAEYDRAIFPVHPRTRNAMTVFGMRVEDYRNLTMVAPVPAIQALGLIKHANVVITDSGCIQEEAAIMRVPCVTVRENTERPETVEAGANIVAGFAPAAIAAAVRTQAAKAGAVDFPPVYGAPGVGLRIVATLLEDATAAAPVSPDSAHAGVLYQ